jgi:hypothetical protein
MELATGGYSAYRTGSGTADHIFESGAGTERMRIRGNANGFTLGGAAASGKYIRGDGTNFVASDLLVSKSISLLDPTTAESGAAQFYWQRAVTLERIACSTDAGTVSINLNERAESTPNTSGSDALSASLMCDTDSQTTTSFSDSVQAADVPIALTITATSGAPTVVRVHVRAREN